MSIREIYNFIRANRGQMSREELLNQLRKQGYLEEEIQSALMFEHHVGLREDERRGKEASAVPMLGDFVLGQKKAVLPLPAAVASRREGDRGLAQKGQRAAGFIIPLFIYLVGLLFLPAREAESSAPSWIPQLVLLWISAALAIVLYAFLHRTQNRIGDNIPYGVIALMVLGFASLFVRHLSAIVELLT